MPYAVFTEPELGRVGMSVKQAEDAGAEFVTVDVKMKSNNRARVIGEGVGFVRLVVEANDPEGRLLGATVLGPAAGELVHAFVMLMHLDRGLASIQDAIFIHPTLFEVVHQAVDTWHKERT